MKKVFALFISLILSIIVILLFILIKLNIISIEIVNNEKNIDEYINNGLCLDDESLNSLNGQQDTFYYDQLSDVAQIIYDEIVINEETLKSGNEDIYFEEGTFDDVLNQTDGFDVLSDEYQNAVDALRYDKLNLFYIDFSKMALRTVTYTRGYDKRYEIYLSVMDGYDNYFEDYVTSKEEIDAMLTEISAIKEVILQETTGSDYQKIQYVHNWIVDNLSYDETYSKEHTRDIYGALLDGEVVCEGYAKVFKYLLDELDIACILVAGDAVNSQGNREQHMWNYVEINGIWYGVDVTWDDPIIVNGDTLPTSSRYKYFCQGNSINDNHFLSTKITDDGQDFVYPSLAEY